jgi:hypothetical protein
MKKLTHDRLRDTLYYDPDTGIFIRRSHRYGPTTERAGTVTNKGHRTIMVDGRKYHARKLAWFYITEHWPKGKLIALNGDNLNDSWGNIDYRKLNMRKKR